MSIVENYRQILEEVRTNLRSIEEPNSGDEYINDSLKIIDKALLDEKVIEKSIVLALENIKLECDGIRKDFWISGENGYLHLDELIAEKIGQFNGRATITIRVQEVISGIKVIKDTWAKPNEIESNPEAQND